MFAQFQALWAHRQLLGTLVSRELKARYRSSSLGFLWSLLNPLLMMVVYSVVFKYYMRYPWNEPGPYELFLFCGLLPWSWFAGALLEGAMSLISGGGMIKSVRFPAELLPLTAVLSNAVHTFFGFCILMGFLVVWGLGTGWALLWLPVVALVQLVFMAGLAMAIGALTVFFRDLYQLLQNLLMLGFFATPILYKVEMFAKLPAFAQGLYWGNPMAHLVKAYQDILFYGRAPDGAVLAGTAVGAVVMLLAGMAIFNRLRDHLAEGI